MFTAMLLSLILTPALPPLPPATHPVIGEWVMVWGGSPQDTRFGDDGEYESNIGRGRWHVARDGSVWFTENENVYGFTIDPATMRGRCWHLDRDGKRWDRGEVSFRPYVKPAPPEPFCGGWFGLGWLMPFPLPAGAP